MTALLRWMNNLMRIGGLLKIVLDVLLTEKIF